MLPSCTVVIVTNMSARIVVYEVFREPMTLTMSNKSAAIEIHITSTLCAEKWILQLLHSALLDDDQNVIVFIKLNKNLLLY